MAIKLIANYSKRLGLPGYSSHQFSVSVETELVTTDDVAGESGRLYQRLQSTVDEQILNTGFVPPADYGMDPPAQNLIFIHKLTACAVCRQSPHRAEELTMAARALAWKSGQHEAGDPE